MKRYLLVLLALLCLNSAYAQEREVRYILRPGDTLELHYRLSPEYDQSVTLEPDGHASLYIAGDLKLGGTTLTQAKSLILAAVSTKLHEPELNIVLKDFQRPYVVVSGQVQSPGKIEMREDMTALQALQLAGGPRSTARTNKVVLLRHINDATRRQVIVLDLSKMKITADLNRDKMLEAGDMLFVTTSRTANVESLIKSLNLGIFVNPLTDF